MNLSANIASAMPNISLPSRISSNAGSGSAVGYEDVSDTNVSADFATLVDEKTGSEETQSDVLEMGNEEVQGDSSDPVQMETELSELVQDQYSAQTQSDYSINVKGPSELSEIAGTERDITSANQFKTEEGLKLSEDLKLADDISIDETEALAARGAATEKSDSVLSNNIENQVLPAAEETTDVGINNSPTNEILAQYGEPRLFSGLALQNAIATGQSSSSAAIPQIQLSQLSAQASLASPALFRGAVNSAESKISAQLDAPTLFRQQPGGMPVIPNNIQATGSSPSSVFGQNNNVLELFAKKASIASPNLNAQMPGTNVASNANNTMANALSQMSNSANIAIQNTSLGAAAQVPVVPLSTVHGISNHIMMQIHPAITERRAPVEASFLTQAPLRSARTMELQLVPRSLGVVELKIQNQNGAVKISIQTQSIEAMQLLKSETSSMLEAFKSAGLKLEEFQISHNSRLEASSQTDRDYRQDNSSFNQHRSGADQNQMANSNSNRDGQNQFDPEIIGSVDETYDANTAEAQSAREGLYL